MNILKNVNLLVIAFVLSIAFACTPKGSGSTTEETVEEVETEVKETVEAMTDSVAAEVDSTMAAVDSVMTEVKDSLSAE